jgi:hypothetical protein
MALPMTRSARAIERMGGSLPEGRECLKLPIPHVLTPTRLSRYRNHQHLPLHVGGPPHPLGSRRAAFSSAVVGGEHRSASTTAYDALRRGPGSGEYRARSRRATRATARSPSLSPRMGADRHGRSQRAFGRRGQRSERTETRRNRLNWKCCSSWRRVSIRSKASPTARRRVCAS